jgi:SAM-dependent methyltransferase
MNPSESGNPWLTGGVRGDAYDQRFADLERAGRSMHGEADFVYALGPRRVLDAGCGTGRVAIELARRGVEVVGVDLDPGMLAAARAKAPELRWVEGDLADPSLDVGAGTFDVVVAAGNVMIFVTPGTEAVVIETLGRHLAPAGRLVAGFQLGGRDRPLTLARYDELAEAAGLVLIDRWATWERAPYGGGGDYAVSVHRRPAP